MRELLPHQVRHELAQLLGHHARLGRGVLAGRAHVGAHGVEGVVEGDEELVVEGARVAARLRELRDLEQLPLHRQQADARLLVLDGQPLPQHVDLGEVEGLPRARLLQDGLELGAEDVRRALRLGQVVQVVVALALRLATLPPQVICAEAYRGLHLLHRLQVEVRVLGGAGAPELGADGARPLQLRQRRAPLLPLQVEVADHESRIRLRLQRGALVASRRAQGAEHLRTLGRLREP